MKSKTDLKELAARESEQVEWKKNVADIEDVIRTVAAFSSDFQNMGAQCRPGCRSPGRSPAGCPA